MSIRSADIEDEIQNVRDEILRNEKELKARKQENERLKLELVGVLDEQFNLLVRPSPSILLVEAIAKPKLSSFSFFSF